MGPTMFHLTSSSVCLPLGWKENSLREVSSVPSYPNREIIEPLPRSWCREAVTKNDLWVYLMLKIKNCFSLFSSREAPARPPVSFNLSQILSRCQLEMIFLAISPLFVLGGKNYLKYELTLLCRKRPFVLITSRKRHAGKKLKQSWYVWINKEP